MSQQENTTKLLVEIPQDFKELMNEILSYDFTNNEMACWILGRRRKDKEKEIITCYELVIPPSNKDRSCVSKIKVKDVVGTIFTSQINISMKVEKKLTKQKHIRITIHPTSRNIEIEQLQIIKDYHQEFYRKTQKVITQEIDLDTILTDCRPLTENFKDSVSSLGDPFKPKHILRQLSASSYTRLTEEQIAKIHIKKKDYAGEHFEKGNPEAFNQTL